MERGKKCNAQKNVEKLTWPKKKYTRSEEKEKQRAERKNTDFVQQPRIKATTTTTTIRSFRFLFIFFVLSLYLSSSSLLAFLFKPQPNMSSCLFSMFLHRVALFCSLVIYSHSHRSALVVYLYVCLYRV